MEKVWAESKKFTITSEYETVFLKSNSKDYNSQEIGSFIGDPQHIYLTKCEKFVIMAGLEMVIYKLQKKTNTYERKAKKSENHYKVFENLWVNGIYQPEYYKNWKYYFHFEKGDGIYRMDLRTYKYELVSKSIVK